MTSPAPPDPPSLEISSPLDLLAAIPFLLGFHPSDSVVLAAVRDRHVHFVARHDLPGPLGTVASRCAEIARAEQVDGVLIIGYGPAEPARQAVELLAGELRRAGVPVLQELRVTDGRFWSGDHPDGAEFRPQDTTFAATAVYRGQVALPDRAALKDQVKSLGGTPRALMTAATTRAATRLAAMLGGDGRAVSRPVRLLRRAGRAAVHEAERRARAGVLPTDDEVAWLGLLMMDSAVRDHACRRPVAAPWQTVLWRDVVRRVDPAHAAPPACVLGYVSWQLGQGALARVAVDRAVEADPGCTMAPLLDQILDTGVPAAVLLGPAALARRRPRPPATRRPARRPGGPDRRPGRRSPHPPAGSRASEVSAGTGDAGPAEGA